MDEWSEDNTLKDQMRNILEEARMILPGIQALFGFQTVAVFNQRFDDLPAFAQVLHLVALASVVLAIALVMMPATWHRIVEPHRVSTTTIQLSSRAICAALLPLQIGLSLDLYVVILLVTESYATASLGAGVTLLVLSTLWFIVPFSYRSRMRSKNKRHATIEKSN